MLTQVGYSSSLHDVQLTGKPLSGVFPWEARWLVDKAKHVNMDVLEIGTFRGATARELAVALPDKTVYAVDVCMPSYGLKREEVGAEAKDLPNYHLTIGDSKTHHYTDLLGMIFIDGDHSWEGVKADTEKALMYFRKVGRPGTIVWHDYYSTYEVMPYLEWIARINHLNILSVQCTQLAYLDV